MFKSTKMKNRIKVCLLIMVTIITASCKKFDEVNVNPISANEDQVQIEYFLNNAITGSQMDPHIAERVFVLYWKTAGHQHSSSGISVGNYNDSWSSDYYTYISGWLNSVNTGIQVAEKQVANGKINVYTNNLIQCSRIWRAYLLSEMADNFGPVPIKGFQGTNPDFVDVKTAYYFMLAELKDAESKINTSVSTPDNVKKLDPAYGYDYTKWKKYANSMRMRLAMRLSEVDADKAKAEFESAASSSNYISSLTDAFQVQEKPGWDALTGVMSREWNPQFISATLNNLYIGLGGISSATLLPASFASAVKPANDLGLRFTDQFTSLTNEPSAGFWLNGLPNTIDPRAYKTFIIPGDFNNPDFNSYPSWTTDAKNTVRNLLSTTGSVAKTIDAKYTWNARVGGDWGAKGSRNQLVTYEGTMPRLSNKYRNSTAKRIFFAPWETYFLLAEAAVKGWTVPIAAKTAYEAGIASSFEYMGVTAHLSAYLSSNDYNRVGTSVNWTHTTEPPASFTATFKDGLTDAPGSVTINYPNNALYLNGNVKNDLLTKIITQKFIAQTPWLPLETWNDHRRLGLPFFENPAIENPLPNLPAFTTTNYQTSNVKFFPQRLKFPSTLANANSKGYAQAVTALGGIDGVLTPLWWAKK